MHRKKKQIKFLSKKIVFVFCHFSSTNLWILFAFNKIYDTIQIFDIILYKIHTFLFDWHLFIAFQKNRFSNYDKRKFYDFSSTALFYLISNQNETERNNKLLYVINKKLSEAIDIRIALSFRINNKKKKQIIYFRY